MQRPDVFKDFCDLADKFKDVFGVLDEDIHLGADIVNSGAWGRLVNIHQKTEEQEQFRFKSFRVIDLLLSI